MVAVGEKRPKGNDLCPEDIRIGFCTLAFNLHGETWINDNVWNSTKKVVNYKHCVVGNFFFGKKVSVHGWRSQLIEQLDVINQFSKIVFLFRNWIIDWEWKKVKNSFKLLFFLEIFDWLLRWRRFVESLIWYFFCFWGLPKIMFRMLMFFLQRHNLGFIQSLGYTHWQIFTDVCDWWHFALF